MVTACHLQITKKIIIKIVVDIEHIALICREPNVCTVTFSHPIVVILHLQTTTEVIDEELKLRSPEIEYQCHPETRPGSYFPK